MFAPPAASLLPDGRRLHLQHGPIDLVIEAWGPREEVALAYRQAWARSYLKAVEAIENSSRGVWSITDAGRALGEPDMPAIRPAPDCAWRARNATQPHGPNPSARGYHGPPVTPPDRTSLR